MKESCRSFAVQIGPLKKAGRIVRHIRFDDAIISGAVEHLAMGSCPCRGICEMLAFRRMWHDFERSCALDLEVLGLADRPVNTTESRRWRGAGRWVRARGLDHRHPRYKPGPRFPQDVSYVAGFATTEIRIAESESRPRVYAAFRSQPGSSGSSSPAGTRPISTAGSRAITSTPPIHRRFEHCAVCGRFRPMLYRRRVIPRRLEELWGLSPRLAEALARKESCDCASCGAKLRCRRIAEAVLALYPVGYPPAPAPSLARWVEYPEIQALRVAEINRIDGLHDCPPAPAALRGVGLSARLRSRRGGRGRPLGGPDAADLPG